MARSIFASFYYDGDADRVQQVLKMGAIEGGSLVTAQEWESVKYKTDAAIESWIHSQMLRKSAVVVLVGSDTANRKWVNYEIRKAWDVSSTSGRHPDSRTYGLGPANRRAGDKSLREGEPQGRVAARLTRGTARSAWL